MCLAFCASPLCVRILMFDPFCRFVAHFNVFVYCMFLGLFCIECVLFLFLFLASLLRVDLPFFVSMVPYNGCCCLFTSFFCSLVFCNVRSIFLVVCMCVFDLCPSSTCLASWSARDMVGIACISCLSCLEPFCSCCRPSICSSYAISFVARRDI